MVLKGQDTDSGEILDAFLNKSPMGHIAHLSNTGSYENIFWI
jgi:hypothetical protein